ncbi:hypothetical protein MRX96_032434 [Rhipicephalus microplus]
MFDFQPRTRLSAHFPEMVDRDPAAKTSPAPMLCLQGTPVWARQYNDAGQLPGMGTASRAMWLVMMDSTRGIQCRPWTNCGHGAPQWWQSKSYAQPDLPSNNPQHVIQLHGTNHRQATSSQQTYRWAHCGLPVNQIQAHKQRLNLWGFLRA